MKSDSATRFKGKPTGSKRAAWCEPLKLAEVKAVSRALGCSINDILLSCVAGAMRSYLKEKGDKTEGVEVRAWAPIDLREPGDLTLGNRFGLVGVLLPVGFENPVEQLMAVRQRMLDLKTSYEPAVTLGLYAALGYLPKIVQDQLFDLLASRSTAVMTNVAGPTEPLKVAGSTIKQNLFWVPQSADLGMGVSIYSYAGVVQFGLITDAALTPDPEAVVSRFPEEFEKYLYYALLDLPPVAQEEKFTPSHRPPPEVDRGKAQGSHREAVMRARTRLAPHFRLTWTVWRACSGTRIGRALFWTTAPVC
jgi:WS/DGAT/MGAT family acyltransferase